MLLMRRISEIDRPHSQQHLQHFRNLQQQLQPQHQQHHFQQQQQQQQQQHKQHQDLQQQQQTPDLIEQDLQLLKNGVIYNSLSFNNFNDDNKTNNHNNKINNNLSENNSKINSNNITATSNNTIHDKCPDDFNTLNEKVHFSRNNNNDEQRKNNDSNMNQLITTTTPSTTTFSTPPTLKEYNYKHKLILAKNALTVTNSSPTPHEVSQSDNGKIDSSQSDAGKIDSNSSMNEMTQTRSNNSTPESKTQDFSPISPLEAIDQPMADRNENVLPIKFEFSNKPSFSLVRDVYDEPTITDPENKILNAEKVNDDDDDECNSEFPESPNQTNKLGLKKERQNSFNTDYESKDGEDNDMDDDDENNIAEDSDKHRMPDLLLQHATTLDQLKHHHSLYNPYLQKAYEDYKHFSDPGRNVMKRELSQDGFQLSPSNQQPPSLHPHPLANLWQQYKNSNSNSNNNLLNQNNNSKSECQMSLPHQSPFRNSSGNKTVDGNESESSSASNKRNVFCCHICSFVGTSEDDFNSHMTQHFEHQCPHCTYSSRTEGRLKRHIKDFHSNEDSIYTGQHKVKSSAPKRTCRYCKFYTYDQVEFWIHLKKHIKPEKLLECPHCEFVTELKHHLEYHIRVHIGSKPFKCPKCNYSCVNKSMLNSHMKSHTNVYQFRCRDCNYATKYSHSLKLHLIKKKHHADVVLNSDGSMPTDGTGHFDAVNRRGPPRGPRTIKKSKEINNAFALRQHLANPFKFLADPRLHFASKPNTDDYFWNDSHRSRSPSEASSASKDENLTATTNHHTFPPLPGLYPTPSALPTRPPACLPVRLFDCSFCLEKFPTPMSLKCHVEEIHYRDLMIFKFNQSKQTTSHIENQLIKTEQVFSTPTKSEFREEALPAVDNVALDLSSGTKRKTDEDKDSGHADSPSSVHSSPDSLVRKRSRKGRAFKLQAEKFEDRSAEKEDHNNDDDNVNDDTKACTPVHKTDDNGGAKRMESSQKEENKRTSPSLSQSSSEQNIKLKVDSSWHLCRHCEMAFADQMTHRLHMGYHGYFNPFQCNGCGENCVDAFDFMLHLMCKAHN